MVKCHVPGAAAGRKGYGRLPGIGAQGTVCPPQITINLVGSQIHRKELPAAGGKPAAVDVGARLPAGIGAAAAVGKLLQNPHLLPGAVNRRQRPGLVVCHIGRSRPGIETDVTASAARKTDRSIYFTHTLRRFFAADQPPLASLFCRVEGFSTAKSQIGGIFCRADALLPVHPIRFPAQGQYTRACPGRKPVGQLRIFANQNHGASPSCAKIHILNIT